MQKFAQISLNAIRIFATVARNNSISLAADELGVTPSAVSHQIKNLETSLGVTLFSRGNNSIILTDAGRSFLEDANPGLNILNQAAEKLLRDTNEIVVRVSVTLAVRWLIPALEKFKKQYPEAKIRVETSPLSDITLDRSADVAITYRRYAQYDCEGEKLLADICRPVLSPNLLCSTGYKVPDDIGRVPALQCTPDNWDWELWANQTSVPENRINITDQFDIDDAALHAAVAGLGMVLSPALMSRTEINTGALVVLPGFKAVELGRYYLLTGLRRDGIVKQFRNWLFAEMEHDSQV